MRAVGVPTSSAASTPPATPRARCLNKQAPAGRTKDALRGCAGAGGAVDEALVEGVLHCPTTEFGKATASRIKGHVRGSENAIARCDGASGEWLFDRQAGSRGYVVSQCRPTSNSAVGMVVRSDATTPQMWSEAPL